jgi:4-alpha-glucanotransferase
MSFPRSSGLLLHPTSLPGKYGIGDLGTEAYNFVNFLEAAGQSLWQVLPLGPTGYGDSPYQCFSAFAGNPYLISPERLVADGLLEESEINVPPHDPRNIDFGPIIEFKLVLLRKAFERFDPQSDPVKEKVYTKFCEDNKFWLEDYALFMSVKDAHGGNNWNSWEPDIKQRKPAAMKSWKSKLEREIRFYEFVQFEFFRQWAALKDHANTKGIQIVGDAPIFIAYDSADAWSDRDQFTISPDGTLLKVAGVPPDFFSPMGQLWGNPLYNWKDMEEDDFLWWRRRITKMLETVDIIRFDHFRGFEAYWEIPGGAPTAQTGKWVKAPGKKFFGTLEKKLGKLPIMAEDLGLITEPVIELRDGFGFPGMKILQFAFGEAMEHQFLPHHFISNCIVYTGSHDNDTTRGYFEKAKSDGTDHYLFAQKYLNTTNDNFVFEMIRLAFASVADTAIIPMQDVLNLDSEARMNFPGRLGGNWSWRFTWDQVSPDLAPAYAEMTRVYERNPRNKKKTA